MMKYIFLWLGFALFPFLLFSQKNEVITPGDVTSLKQNKTGADITTGNALVRLEVCSPTVIRIRMDRGSFKKDLSYAVIREAAMGFTRITNDAEGWKLTTDSLSITVVKKPFRLVFMNKKGDTLAEDYSPFPYTWLGTSVTSYKRLFSDEKFIGLGEKTGPMDRRGNGYTNWNSDIPAYSTREDPLYVTIPFYMGIHGNVCYGIFFDNSYRSSFNFAASTDDKFSSFGAADGEMNYYFFGASTVAGIIRDYTWLTGRMELPPLWTLGYQQCRWSYFPDKEVVNIARTFREKKIPCDVIYLDIHYMDQYKIFTWNNERFPDPSGMISGLNSSGFHVVSIVDPGIKIDKGYNSYEEGVARKLFLKYPDGTFYTGSVWPGRCHFPDFTNPETREWWGNSLKALTDPGVEGFWNDMNEPSAWGQSIPDIVQFNFDGTGGDMTRGHNIYGLEMCRSTYDGTKKLLNGKRTFLLTRAAYAGVQRYSAVWTGDNESNEDHLLMGVRLVNSLGLSGVSFTGSDVGGFVGSPDKDLFTRWMSVGAFTPFFRNHSEYNSRDQEPWAFGEDVESLSRSVIELRYKLLPWLYSEFYESTVSGLPVSRSLHIDYTYDEKIWWWEYMNQYKFGDAFLVAPCSTENFSKVYLPKGTWYRFSSGEKYSGNAEHIVSSPVSDLPVFVKGSAIIPMQSVVQYTDQKPSPYLELHIYNGDVKNSFIYYEDDGKTYKYQQGEFYKRTIIFDPSAGKIILGKKEGNYVSKFTNIRLVLHSFGDIMGIKVNGEGMTLKMKTQPEKTVDFKLTDGEIILDLNQ